MAETLKYGEELLASFPDNQTGLITAEHMRNAVVSAVSGGLKITERDSFTAPMDSGVVTLINPLLPSPDVHGTLWATDTNNRAFQNYAAIIPSLTIPAGYVKLVNFQFMFGLNKIGSGTDTYLFQLDMDGAPVGAGIIYDITTDPQYMAANVMVPVEYDTPHLFGLAITPQGTGDDLSFEAFHMVITDYQLWSAP